MSRQVVKRILLVVGPIAAAIPSLLIYASVKDDFANRSATQFCQGVDVGSDISIAVVRAKASHILFGGPTNASEYVFVFPGFGMDKAICSVAVEQTVVKSKSASMSYD